MLLKDGKKMDEYNNVIIENIVDHDKNKPWQFHQNQQPQQRQLPSPSDLSDIISSTSSIPQLNVEEHRLSQSVPRQVETIYKTDCATLHNNNNNSASGKHRGLVTPQIVSAVSVFLVARPEDDDSKITCFARNALIPSHGELVHGVVRFIILYPFEIINVYS